jgi:hypothetical protein
LKSNQPRPQPAAGGRDTLASSAESAGDGGGLAGQRRKLPLVGGAGIGDGEAAGEVRAGAEHGGIERGTSATGDQPALGVALAASATTTG